MKRPKTNENPSVLKRLADKWRQLGMAIEKLDDPQGEYHRALEVRMRRLECDMDELRKRMAPEG